MKRAGGGAQVPEGRRYSERPGEHGKSLSVDADAFGLRRAVGHQFQRRLRWQLASRNGTFRATGSEYQVKRPRGLICLVLTAQEDVAQRKSVAGNGGDTGSNPVIQVNTFDLPENVKIDKAFRPLPDVS